MPRINTGLLRKVRRGIERGESARQIGRRLRATGLKFSDATLGLYANLARGRTPTQRQAGEIFSGVTDIEYNDVRVLIDVDFGSRASLTVSVDAEVSIDYSFQFAGGADTGVDGTATGEFSFVAPLTGAIEALNAQLKDEANRVLANVINEVAADQGRSFVAATNVTVSGTSGNIISVTIAH